MIVNQHLNNAVIEELKIFTLSKTVDEVLAYRGVLVDVGNVDIL